MPDADYQKEKARKESEAAEREKWLASLLQGDRFRAGVYEQMQAFETANKAAAQRAFNDMRQLTEREFKLLYGEGVGAVDEAVKRARAKGHDILAQQKRSTSVRAYGKITSLQS